MPQGKVSNPVDFWCLTVVNSNMVIVAMDSASNAGFRRLLAQTQDSIEVCFLLWLWQLSPNEMMYEQT
jgi:hypothetical protein